MPAPAAAAAVTATIIIGVAAAGFAFVKFVYEPHIAPKLEQWAEEFLAHREAQRQRTQPLLATPHPHRRDSESEDGHSDSSDEGGKKESIELENLIAKEVREWRSDVNRSQTLRYRGKSSSRLKPIQMSPVHVLVDPSIPSTPTSTLPSTGASPAPHVSPLREVSSPVTPRSQTPEYPQGLALLPTPAPSTTLSPGAASPQHAPLSPGMIPSLSQSHPLELDQEHGIELLSAPSSRPDSPFSTFSQPRSPSIQDTNLSTSQYYSFSSPNTRSIDNIMSPALRPPSRSLSDLDFLSDLGAEHMLSPHWSDVGVIADDHRDEFDDSSSDRSESSWASAGVRSR
ncbi:hypothetical protein H0H92_012154 [Tricholoma furcatifolium]|nr:hypothetical protein H0H92_012154 [Tricholoma furcatifolium]